MNKFYSVLTLVILCIAASVGARVIKDPDFRMSPSDTFSISKVELSDTATRISADIYGSPGDCVVADGDYVLHGEGTGNEYKLRRIEGLYANQNVLLPDSAYVNAVFVFPPLAAADTIVDFIDKKSQGKIWNVSGLNLGQRSDGNIITNIAGTIGGRPDLSWLILMPAQDDPRVNKFRIIPVRNGRFSYRLTTQEPELYVVLTGVDMLRGSMTLYSFFAEGDDVHIDIPTGPVSETDIPVKGGPLTQRFWQNLKSGIRYVSESGINESMDSLRAVHGELTPEAYAIIEALNSGDNLSDQKIDSLNHELTRLQEQGLMLSEEAMRLQSRAERIYKEADDIRNNFIKNDTTLLGLYYIYSKMKQDTPDFRAFLPVFADVYRKRFPNHKYSKAISWFIGVEAAEPGFRVPDFSAPDLEGNVYTLSELIKGKVALVDLWASWCGPCRRHSRALIPVYGKWKDRNFTVVGIANESVDTEAMKKAIAHDGYPWLNLVELNGAGHIWERYGAALGGGRQILVDTEGRVISVDPTAEEVDRYMEQYCNDLNMGVK